MRTCELTKRHVQAINIFCDVQLKMEAMMKERGAV